MIVLNQLLFLSISFFQLLRVRNRVVACLVEFHLQSLNLMR